jgi:transposase-like protein
METKDISLASISEDLAKEQAAYDFLEAIRWPNGPVCPHCGTINHAYHLKPKSSEGRKTRTGAITFRKVWKCGACRKQFTVTVGTCMERSKIPLRKWVMAFHMLSASKNGVSSHELGRQLQISHESAWFLSQRIRYAFSDPIPSGQLSGTVEADETYVGGKRKHIPGVSHTDLKVPVVTLVERGGKVRSKVLPTVTSKNIKAHLQAHVSPDAALMTDQSRLYNQAGQGFASHETVDHARDEWVRGKAHVNTAEGFFSQLKRSLDGTHHHVSPRHLHRYVGEFDFRYNTRKVKDGERTALAIRRSAGKRLMYQQVTKRPQQ